MYSGEEIGENNDSQNEEEEWPPFRRVGTFDPYSDDPRLAVKKVLLPNLLSIVSNLNNNENIKVYIFVYIKAICLIVIYFQITYLYR